MAKGISEMRIECIRKSEKRILPVARKLFFGGLLIMQSLCATNSYAAEKGLIGFWPLNEGQGKIAKDQSAFNNNGVIHDAHWTKTAGGQMLLSFNGTNSFIDCGNKSVFNEIQELTIDFWINADASSGNRRIITKGDKGNGQADGYQYCIYLSNDNIHFLVSNGTKSFDIKARICLLTFQHVIATWDGRFMKLFVSDQLVAEGEVSGPLNDKTSHLGLHLGSQNGQDSFFKGALKDVKIYNVVRQPAHADTLIIPIHNTSFNQHNADNIPDWWGICGASSPESIKNWSGNIEVAPGECSPVAGTKALKLVNPLPNCNLTILYGTFSAAIPLASGEYTFSLHIKSKNEKQKVKFKIGDAIAEEDITRRQFIYEYECDVTNEWKPYNFTFSIKTPCYCGISITLPDKGTIWLTAIQLEKGHAVTPYKCSAQYRPALNNAAERQEVHCKIQPRKKELFKATVEKSFYTSEKTARLFYAAGHPDAACLQITVADSDDSNKIFYQGHPSIKPRIRAFLSFPIKKIPIGRHKLQVKMLGQDAQVLTEKQLTLTKLPTNDRQVCINQIKRCLEIKQKPWLAYIMNWSFPPREEEDAWQLDDIKEKGFAAIRVPLLERPSDIGILDDKEEKYWKFLDRCLARDLKVIIGAQPGTATAGRDIPFAEYKTSVVNAIKKLKDHPAIIAWNFVDEPELWWDKTKGGKQEKDLTDFYNGVKQVDPYRPAFVNYSTWPETGPQYGSLLANDIGSIDVYPIGNAFANNPDLRNIVPHIAAMNKNCSALNKPSGWFHQFFFAGYREPTPDEVKCMTYLNFIYGTRLFNYFTYKPMSASLWNSMKPLGNELKMLFNLTSDENSHELAAGNLNNKGFHYCMWRLPDSYLLICANLCNIPCKVTFDISDFSTTKGKAKALFKKETIMINKGIFCDCYDALECKAYQITIRNKFWFISALKQKINER